MLYGVFKEKQHCIAITGVVDEWGANGLIEDGKQHSRYRRTGIKLNKPLFIISPCGMEFIQGTSKNLSLSSKNLTEFFADALKSGR